MNTSISQATSRIVHDFYEEQASFVTFTSGYVNEVNRLRQLDVINEVLHSGHGHVKFRLQEFCHISSNYSEENNLIFIDSYEGFS